MFLHVFLFDRKWSMKIIKTTLMFILGIATGVLLLGIFIDFIIGMFLDPENHWKIRKYL